MKKKRIKISKSYRQNQPEKSNIHTECAKYNCQHYWPMARNPCDVDIHFICIVVVMVVFLLLYA